MTEPLQDSTPLENPFQVKYLLSVVYALLTFQVCGALYPGRSLFELTPEEQVELAKRTAGLVKGTGLHLTSRLFVEFLASPPPEGYVPAVPTPTPTAAPDERRGYL
jgi:hypothetical protein